MRAMMGLLLLGGCAPAPEAQLSWRESWELLALLEGRQIVDGRVVVGNTGLLKGQAQLKLDRWPRRETPLRFVQYAAPVTVQIDPQHGGVSLAANGLDQDGEAWSLRVADDHINALLRLTPTDTDAPQPVVSWDAGRWTAQAPVISGEVSGWMAAGERGGLIRGEGLLLRRGGVGWPTLPRQAAFVFTRAVQIGVDGQGEGRLAWARIDGTDLPLTDLRVAPGAAPGSVILDLRPAADLVAVFSPERGSGGTTLPHEHLSLLERTLLHQAWGTVTRTVQDASVEIQHDGQQRRVPGLLLGVSRAP